MNEIFISYSSKEYDVAEKLRSAFAQRGIYCWMAPESIPIGSNYAIEIPKAIQACQVFLIILSDNSQNSVWVRKEIDLAVNRNKRIVPLVVNKCQIISPFDFYLTDIQMIQAVDSPDEMAELVLKKIGMDLSAFSAEERVSVVEPETTEVEALSVNQKPEEKAEPKEKETQGNASVWTCSFCGASNSHTSAQCSKCGRLQTAGKSRAASSGPLTDWICSDCGEKNSRGAVCCVKCKAKKSQSAVSGRAAQPQVSRRPEQQNAGKWLCPDCGASNPRVSAQCSKCGKLYAGIK